MGRDKRGVREEDVLWTRDSVAQQQRRCSFPQVKRYPPGNLMKWKEKGTEEDERVSLVGRLDGERS